MDPNMYCDILKQKMMSSFQKLQDDNCLAAEGEGDGVAKYISTPEPY